MKKQIFILFIFLFLISCKKDMVFEEYKKIENNNWSADSIIRFKYLIEDTLSRHEITLKIRHTVDYKYRNLYLFLGNENNKDTLEIILAEKSGKWKGRGIGEFREITRVVKKDELYNRKKHYIINIEHAMRYGSEEKIENLKNISSLALMIRRIDEKN